jgi:hypothetical protein
MKALFLLLATTVGINSGHIPLASKGNSFSNSVAISKAMQTNKMPYKLNVSFLEAYEDKRTPPGASANYPKAHAVIRLRIENLGENKAIAGIQTIEVREVKTNKVLFSQVVKPINLGGLQILEQGFHLTNPTGFKGFSEVKAVVTYKLENKIYSSESAKFKVVVNP